MFSLNEQDRQRLQNILADFSDNAHRTITLNKLFNEWWYLVAEVERGYTWGYDEYTNDLSSRDLLHYLIEHGPDALGEQLTVLLAPWDARFRAATNEDAAFIPHSSRRSAWWWSRVPKLGIDN